MGRLVQHPPAARADRQHPAGRGRSQLLRRSGGAGTRRLTQTKRPPRKSGRFTVDLYTLYIRAPLERLLTILVPWPRTWLTSVMVDGLMFWIAFFLAVNLFVYRHERNFLPGHIYRSYCQLGAPGVGSGALCVLPK